jgi:hypothetical protein
MARSLLNKNLMQMRPKLLEQSSESYAARQRGEAKPIELVPVEEEWRDAFEQVEASDDYKTSRSDKARPTPQTTTSGFAAQLIGQDQTIDLHGQRLRRAAAYSQNSPIDRARQHLRNNKGAF